MKMFWYKLSKWSICNSRMKTYVITGLQLCLHWYTQETNGLECGSVEGARGSGKQRADHDPVKQPQHRAEGILGCITWAAHRWREAIFPSAQHQHSHTCRVDPVLGSSVQEQQGGTGASPAKCHRERKELSQPSDEEHWELRIFGLEKRESEGGHPLGGKRQTSHSSDGTRGNSHKLKHMRSHLNTIIFSFHFLIFLWYREVSLTLEDIVQGCCGHFSEQVVLTDLVWLVGWTTWSFLSSIVQLSCASFLGLSLHLYIWFKQNIIWLLDLLHDVNSGLVRTGCAIGFSLAIKSCTKGILPNS